MSLSNYSDLVTSVANWMNRTDLGSVIPDFVTIAESRIAKDLRLRNQLTSGTLTTSTSSRAVSLPSGFLEFASVNIDGTPATICTYITPEHLDAKFPADSYSGRPAYYAIQGDQVLFGPSPDAAYTVNVDYFTRFPALASASTNWLMTNHPNIYLSACMAQGCLFTMNREGAGEWNAVYKTEVAELQKDDDMAAHSGSVMRVKSL